MSERILVVDDDASIRETFEIHLPTEGYEVTTAGSAEEALSLLSELDPAVMIADVRLPGMSGIELLGKVREAGDDVDVVIITAHEDMQTAVAAMKAGAYDYLVKPLDLDEIDLLLERCLGERSLRRRVRHLSAEASEAHALDRMVGRDPAMIEVYKLIGVLAQNRATVLIRGETGTGKECIARAIHFNSPHADEPFVAVNCTALPETLLEAELFGHTRGAFTGAVQSRKGYFEVAGLGTVFLDEIGDTGPEFQAKLLRVLEEGEFQPIGAERPRQTRARVIAATHRPLEELVSAGTFRDDLYFRLKVIEIQVPPLRERPGDIPLLADHLLAKIRHQMHREVLGIADEAQALLGSYEWPGNVRELENALTRAAVLARGPVIGREHVLLGVPRFGAEGGAAHSTNAQDDTLVAVEAAHVQRVLDRTGGNKRQTARILQISRPRLDRLIEKHGLSVS
jgi:DNA-binding NtrC family response regulator